MKPGREQTEWVDANKPFIKAAEVSLQTQI